MTQGKNFLKAVSVALSWCIQFLLTCRPLSVSSASVLQAFYSLALKKKTDESVQDWRMTKLLSLSAVINGSVWNCWGGAQSCLMNQKMKWLLLGIYWLDCWWHSSILPKVNWTWTQKIKRLSRVSVTAGPSGNRPLKCLLIRFV